jgi:tetratricopeptide (TPR) repeat protein
MSAVKGLLVQAVDRYIGNSDVLEKIQSAMKLTCKGRSDKAELELWGALEASLSNSKTIIIVDGVDHIASEPNKKLEFLEKIKSLSSRVESATIKAIALSQPLTTAAPPLTQHFSIEQDQITRDIYRFILSSISSWQPFRDMTEDEKKGIAKIVSDKSKGSFLWADLAFAAVRQEQNLLAVKQAVERLPRSIEDLVDVHISMLSNKKIDSKSLLAWILASERPLLVSEIKAMLEIDPAGCMHVPRYTRIKDDIREQCGSLITIREGVVFLRHSSIRQHFDSDKSIHEYSFNSKETHHELVLRCLAFVKTRILTDAEPTYECMKIQAIHDLFDRYELLEYCAMYWTTHFRSSSLYENDGKHKLSAHFRACFPNSNILALVEGSCSLWQFGARKTKSLRLLAYTTRKMVFGQRSVSVFQSLMHVVRICYGLDLEDVGDREEERKELWAFSFEAWNLSTLMADVGVALVCAKIFIQTLTITITKRAMIATQKEQVLKFIIDKYKHSHGASHLLTIKHTRILAELYVNIHELEKAVVLYQEMYEITVEKYDYFHEETSRMYEILLKQLNSLSKFDTILEIVRNYHEHVIRTLSITDERRWKSTLALVKIYEERHETTKAEEILLSFWRSVSKTKITEVSILQTKVEVTLEYSRFLTRHERKEESLVIVRGLWSEIEVRQEYFHNKTFFKKVQMIAEEFKSLKEFSFARSVYSSLWSYYEKHEERTSTEAIEIATSLAETVTEIVSISSSSTTKSETTVLTIEEERTLREVFQSALSQSTTTISSTAMKICVALATSYSTQERWSEAVEVYSETISKAWSSIETSIEIKELTVENHSEVVEVAMSLASCRFEMLQIEKSEFIYQNLFRSMIRMATCNQQFFSRIFDKVIEFFEKTYRFERAIDIYKESFVYLEAKLGKSHQYTIQVLRSYGSLSKRLRMWKEVEQAYRHIFNAYKGQDGCCAVGGVELALELCTTFERRERWDEARTIYICLWQTFMKRGKEYSLKKETVELIYEKYIYILEHKMKVEYSAVQKLAVEYRNTCTSFYGSQSEITIRATMQLAQIYEKSVEYHKESMSLYEEVLKATTSMSSTTKR